MAIITDDERRSGDVARAVPSGHEVRFVDLGEAAPGPMSEAVGIILVDVPLADSAVIQMLRRHLDATRPGLAKVFIANKGVRQEVVQAQSLGAREVMSRQELLSRCADIVAASEPASDTTRAIATLDALDHDLFTAVRDGSALPRDKIESCGQFITHTLARYGLSSWLTEVESYHSYTYRHSMAVCGFAIAFAVAYKMREDDTLRIATGALLHDIGKAHIPLDILDKPGKLTDSERFQISKHPVYSGDVLRKDGQFDDEVVAVARHHHEFLDGSGYPDGLAGSDIADLVRIMTIVDVFSALVDERSYKRAMPHRDAYAHMLKMDGKLDFALLRGFEKVALE